MNYKPGMIVRSKAGHDKDHVYVIIRVEKNYLYLSDGDLKPLNQMKKKRKLKVKSQ